MAPPPGTLRVGRYFLALTVLLVLLYGIVFLGDQHTPKLGLDLVGGQQVIFQAKTPNGSTPSSSSMSQARQILAERVNGTGVTEATVVIQGDDQLVVSIPGGTETDVAKLGAAAVLNMRGLVAPAQPVACRVPTATGSGSATPTSTSTSTASPTASPVATASSTGSPTGSTSPTQSSTSKAAGAAPASSSAPAAQAVAAPSSSAAASSRPPTASGSVSSSAAAAPVCVADPLAALVKSNPSLKIPLTDKQFDALSTAEQQAITSALSTFDCSSAADQPDIKGKYFIACDESDQYVYLLGPVIVPGNQIDSASAQAPNAANSSFEWSVALAFKDAGENAWAKYTAAHNIGDSSGNTNASALTCSAATYACANFVGFTLDGRVISIPVNESAINGGTTRISGSFTEKSANQLADQLRFGALPLSFEAQQAQSVSATLGSSQLRAGLLAGGIGLILVVIYSLLYYRALGLVTIASLIVSGLLTYAMLVVLGTQIGFTLSLAGIAGFIVAVGITADSFVVFFERIKDEVHEGRSMRVAVPRAWTRARRTILSADTVSFLAAAILYYFAAGDVKGFAFTLGLSTLIDLVVVFLFTHPMVSLLSRSRAFGSARFTGLNAVRDGGIASVEPAGSTPTQPAHSGRTRPAASAVDVRAKSVAVLEEQDEDLESNAVPPDLEPAEDVAAAPHDGGPEGEDTATAPGGDDAEPTRSTPQPGTAAERAAARRARMRAGRDEEGQR